MTGDAFREVDNVDLSTEMTLFAGEKGLYRTLIEAYLRGVPPMPPGNSIRLQSKQNTTGQIRR